MSWDHGLREYVYEGPRVRTTQHETVPMLIEAGEVEVLEALAKAGHMPQGLEVADEMGLTPALLAVTYDRPEVLRLLDRLGVNLGAYCDADGYGTPAFYAVYHAKVQCFEMLIRLGVEGTAACTKYGETPYNFLDRHPQHVADQFKELILIRHRAIVTIQRWARRRIPEIALKAARFIVICIQRRWRELRADRLQRQAQAQAEAEALARAHQDQQAADAPAASADPAAGESVEVAVDEPQSGLESPSTSPAAQEPPAS